MEVRFCITTTPRSRSGLLNPPAASSANSCKGVRAWHPPRGGGNDEREKSPKPKNGDFPLSWKAQTPRFPHSHHTTTTAALASPPKQSHKTTMALLATFLTYPQIPQRRHFFEAKCWASPLKELGALYCRLSARQE